MSKRLISRSPDLQQLVEEGYEVEVRGGHLIITNVPYVVADQSVRRGTLVSVLTLAGDVTAKPKTHVVMFSGEEPCDREGRPLKKIRGGAGHGNHGDGLVTNRSFSSKPRPGGYTDYHHKMTTYINILSGPAAAIDPLVTARTYRPLEDREDGSPFLYADTGTASAGIGAVSEKLEVERLAIVGLGGSGSYILDLIAKAPVREIHLYDGDRFLQHNAFRSPGAASVEDLTGGPMKADHFARVYSAMRTGVVPHPYAIDASNVGELEPMSFVFLALDRGSAKREIISRLEEWSIPFVDVGMGISEVDGHLGGILRVTTAMPGNSTVDRGRISFGDRDQNDDYTQNIQIADLNALNAALAVVKWKKHRGFYRDADREHYSAYTVDGNHLLNEDLA